MSESKPKRERRAKPPIPKGELNKQQIAIAAGRLQVKVNNIAKNHAKATETATSRINAKYSDLIAEETLGLDQRVIDAVELPAFFAEHLEARKKQAAEPEAAQ